MRMTELRQRLNAYRAKLNIATEQMDDATALETVALFPAWSAEAEYTVGNRVRYDGLLYRCLQSHTAQADWTPTDAPSLWTRVLVPNPDVIPDWVQPDSTNPYMTGDKVRHNDRVWISDIDGNVWEPGVYGWTETEE